MTDINSTGCQNRTWNCICLVENIEITRKKNKNRAKSEPPYSVQHKIWWPRVDPTKTKQKKDSKKKLVTHKTNYTILLQKIKKIKIKNKKTNEEST